MKDHEKRELVNKLTSIARQYEQTQQLRDQIAHCVLGAIEQALIEEREICAKICEKQAEERFFEHGTRETDTGATYYRGRMAEEYEARDEEDESCAAAIRQLSEKSKVRF